jgi:hypothetical protein
VHGRRLSEFRWRIATELVFLKFIVLLLDVLQLVVQVRQANAKVWELLEEENRAVDAEMYRLV